jgi:transposase
MLDMEEFLMLRDLFNEGLSISEIARRTGHSRGTIRKYLSSQAPPASKKRSKKPSKLDGYKEYIISRLQEYPLTAKCIYRVVCRIFCNLRSPVIPHLNRHP